MKLRLRGILTELGSNYVTHDIVHSGAIIQCNNQNLHFDLTSSQVQALAPHLFDVVDITLTLRRRDEAESRPRKINVGNKPGKKKAARRGKPR